MDENVKVAPRWWLQRKMPEFGMPIDFSPTSWIEGVLFENALDGGPKVCVKRVNGNLTSAPDEFLKEMQDVLALRTVRAQPSTKDINGYYVMASDVAMATAHLHGKGKWADVTFATADEALFTKASELLNNRVVPDDPSAGPVFTLAKTKDGYEITRIGVAGVPLMRGNYNNEALKHYDHIIEDLNTHSPCGRLVILSGEPGTGKTFLVRAMLTQVPNATFILVPPHLVQSLGDPEILPSLTEAKHELEGPIVLLAEDGDMCLIQREGDNMSTVQTILNMGDGILGSLLDIRILITTNAAKFAMDKAALRSGRLCRQLEIGRLPFEQANNILLDLVGSHGHTVRNYGTPDAKYVFDQKTGATLADVYSAARKQGWVAPEAKPSSNTKNAYPTPM